MQPDKPNSILVINIRLIGDVVLSTPLLDILSTEYPEAYIDFLVNRGTGEFLEKDPRVRRVYYSEKWQRGFESISNNYLFDIFRKYDMALSLNSSDRTCLAAVVAGKHTRIGYFDERKSIGSWWRKLFMNPALPYCLDLHVVHRCKEITDAIGIRADRFPVRLFWDRSDADLVAAILVENSVKRRFLVVHPFARWHYKYWDLDRFVELSDMVADRFGLVPIWTSSPDLEEIALLATTSKRCSTPPVIIPGTLSLNQMACLIDQAALYIGLDTAISHIAASTGTPMVALYGPTEMWRWHPWDNEASLVEANIAIGCRGTYRSGHIVAIQEEGCEHYPCIRPQCYRDGLENPCLMRLTVSDVFQEITDLLSGSGIEYNDN